ncbi:MAG: hypothetical protein WC043_08820 [Pseudobdellovibrionaceae bacterium]
MDHLSPENKRPTWIVYVWALLCLGLVVATVVVYVVREQQVAREGVFVELSQNTHLNMVWGELLSVAQDDVFLAGFGGEDMLVNMSDRQKYFTYDAWADYQVYVSWQKEQLKVRGYSEALSGDTVIGTYSDKNGGYSMRDDGRYQLHKTISFSYGSGCTHLFDDKVSQFDILFTLDGQGQPLISQWTVGPEEKL